MASTVSNTVAVTVSPVIQAPVLAGVLTGNPVGSRIQLTWTCATGGITAFTVYKNTNNNGFQLLVTLAGTVFSYTDTITDDPVDDEDSAAYTVVAAINTAVSGPSNEVTNNAGL